MTLKPIYRLAESRYYFKINKNEHTHTHTHTQTHSLTYSYDVKKQAKTNTKSYKKKTFLLINDHWSVS